MTQTLEGCKQHAMARFGEVNWTEIPAMYQPRRHVDLQVCGERLHVEIDFYSESGAADAAGDGWHYAQWERETLCLDAPASRSGWREVWQVVRALLGGRTVTFRDGTAVSRATFLAEARA